MQQIFSLFVLVLAPQTPAVTWGFADRHQPSDEGTEGQGEVSPAPGAQWRPASGGQLRVLTPGPVLFMMPVAPLLCVQFRLRLNSGELESSPGDCPHWVGRTLGGGQAFSSCNTTILWSRDPQRRQEGSGEQCSQVGQDGAWSALSILHV